MEILTWAPDFGIKVDFEPRIREAKFGNGYSQRSAAGPNSNLMKFSGVTWTGKTEVVGKQINDFFTRHEGWKSFLWTPPTGTTQKKFICKKWSMQVSFHNVYSVTADLEEVI